MEGRSQSLEFIVPVVEGHYLDNNNRDNDLVLAASGRLPVDCIPSVPRNSTRSVERNALSPSPTVLEGLLGVAAESLNSW